MALFLTKKNPQDLYFPIPKKDESKQNREREGGETERDRETERERGRERKRQRGKKIKSEENIKQGIRNKNKHIN